VRLLALLVLAGCWTSTAAPPPPGKQAEPATSCDACLHDVLRVVVHPEYSVSAQVNFERGKAALEARELVLATRYFEFLQSRFPYSRYAQLGREELDKLVDDVERDCVAKCRTCSRSCPSSLASGCLERCRVR
jgi:hypothetical protein